MPSNAEKVPLRGLADVTTGGGLVPSITQGGKLPVSNPPFTIVLGVPIGCAAAGFVPAATFTVPDVAFKQKIRKTTKLIIPRNAPVRDAAFPPNFEFGGRVVMLSSLFVRGIPLSRLVTLFASRKSGTHLYLSFVPVHLNGFNSIAGSQPNLLLHGLYERGI